MGSNWKHLDRAQRERILCKKKGICTRCRKRPARVKQTKCSTCAEAELKRQRALRPPRVKHTSDPWKLSKKDYGEKLSDQGGVCGICRKAPLAARRLAVDHNHKTGRTRGLLCTRCNMGLGFFKDDLALLGAAVAYLKTHTD